MNEAEKIQMSPEQAADMAALSAAAESDIQPGEEAAALVDPAEQWAMLPRIVGSILSIGMPELHKVYTPAACRQWGEAMIPCAAKYGWFDDVLGGPEMGLLAASVPFLIGTFTAVKAKKMQIAEPAPAKPEVDPVVM